MGLEGGGAGVERGGLEQEMLVRLLRLLLLVFHVV